MWSNRLQILEVLEQFRPQLLSVSVLVNSSLVNMPKDKFRKLHKIKKAQLLKLNVPMKISENISHSFFTLPTCTFSRRKKSGYKSNNDTTLMWILIILLDQFQSKINQFVSTLYLYLPVILSLSLSISYSLCLKFYFSLRYLS